MCVCVCVCVFCVCVCVCVCIVLQKMIFCHLVKTRILSIYDGLIKNNFNLFQEFEMPNLGTKLLWYNISFQIYQTLYKLLELLDNDIWILYIKSHSGQSVLCLYLHEGHFYFCFKFDKMSCILLNNSLL